MKSSARMPALAVSQGTDESDVAVASYGDDSRRGRHIRGALWVFASLVAVLIAVLSACTAPGKGVKAESGYASAAPVIEALEAYRHANTAYPTSLHQLVPQFTAGDKLMAKLPANTDMPFKYRQVEESYELSFSYAGPGTNECVYRARERAWKCHGVY